MLKLLLPEVAVTVAARLVTLLGDGVVIVVVVLPPPPKSAEDGEGDRPAEAGAAPVLLPAGVGRLNGLPKELQEQVGHCRGSSVLLSVEGDKEEEARDWRSQCLPENTGMSKKAQ